MDPILEMRNNNSCYIFFSIVTFLSACSNLENRAVVRVNDMVITVAECRTRLKEYSYSPTENSIQFSSLKESVLHELIEEKILLQEAKKRKIKTSKEDINNKLKTVENDYASSEDFQTMLKSKNISYARLKEKVKRQISIEKTLLDIMNETIPIKPEAVKNYYETHTEEFLKPAEFYLQQIVVKTKDEAQEILQDLQKAKTFEDLAKNYSVSPEGAQGGIVGWVTKTIVPSQMEKTLVSMPIEKVGPIIETEYGFHLIKILDKKPERMETFEEVKPKIEKMLAQKAKELYLATWKRETFSKAKIERNHALLESIR